MQREIVGVCRFSFLGRGDWKIFNNLPPESEEEVIQSLREKLFDEERLEHRFGTFETLTLPGLNAQSDRDFLFIALTSDELPEKYLDRLLKLSARYQFLEVVRMPVMRSPHAVGEAYKKFGLELDSIIQFRLDDDDTVSCHYISRLREACSTMVCDPAHRPFAVTFPNALIYGPVVSPDGATETKLMRRFVPHTGAGQAICHNKRNILQWAHNRVDRQLVSFSDPSVWVLQSYFAENDTGALTPFRIKQQKIEEIPQKQQERIIQENFPFLVAT
ncbi:glycosyltransferase [Paracoccus alkanivorans]|uniref:Rhamnosyl transferase n=1 Tax=Paracoccus alkanivorans TaxID=2116655 RepID=A0A3M0MPW4_9RHOB|nr:glycosyltransferase [Paracoccus alkanivorans]RMC37760.1 hypothetical protein C9E81_03210 [Paracoccus alkanivorans]